MDNSNKLKEGMLQKESRHIKVWRDRWVVLKETKLYTFENQGVYGNPTGALLKQKVIIDALVEVIFNKII